MLIDIKSMLRVGDILVALICMFDRTHLSNFAGDKQEWTVYMTIRNQSSRIRKVPSTHSVMMVTLLLMSINNHNISQNCLHKQQYTNREVLKDVHWLVLQPLTVKDNTSTESGQYNVLCADGNYRRCKPV